MRKNYFFCLFLIPALGMGQIQIGQDIFGYGGWSNTSLSSSGDIVVVAATNPTFSKVYEEISGTWIQKGQDIPARGYSTSLSSLGNTVALGDNLNNNSNGIGAGTVRVYEIDYVKGIWKQKGKNIDGKTVGEQSGFNISLSSD